MGKKVHLTVRIDEELLKEYKKWLIDRGYKSINQHLNEVIRKILKEDNRIPLSSEEESILRRKS
jgi:metal-responsive CopG/Arc/MetJ family transcriptional regulator